MKEKVEGIEYEGSSSYKLWGLFRRNCKVTENFEAGLSSNTWVWKMFPCNRVRTDFEGLGWGRRSRALQAISAGTVQFYCSAKSLQSCPTLWDLIDGSPPGSPIPGILQARTLEWVAQCMKVKSQCEVPQLCLTLPDPMDCNQAPPSMGFSRQEDWSGAPLPSLIYALVYDIHFSLSGCHSF